MWPCGHGKEWRWHQAWRWHEATKHGKEMVMAPGMDVARSHGGTAKNGGGTWPWGHNEDMAVAQGREVTRGHVGTARTW